MNQQNRRTDWGEHLEPSPGEESRRRGGLNSDKRFRAFAEASFEGIIIIERGRVVDANARLCEILGYELSELLGREVLDFVAPDDRDVVRARIESQSEEPYEHRALRKDGATIDVEVCGRRTLYQGRPCRITALLDITKHRAAEQAALESERRFRALFEAAPDAIFLADPESGRILDANAAAARLLGRPLKEIIGLHQADLHPRERSEFSREAFRAHLQSIMDGGRARPIENLVVRRDGSHVPVEVLAELVHLQGRPVIQGVFRDLTERKRAEKALEYRLEFEDIIASISTTFINVAPNEVDAEITKALERLGEFADVDRSYVFQFRDNCTKMDNTHEWCRPGIASHRHRLQNLNVDDFSVARDVLRCRRVLQVTNLEDLPPGAREERREFETEGIRSLVHVPLFCGDTPIGLFGFDSVRAERRWSEDILSLLRTVGEVLAGLLARGRAEAEKAKLAEQLRQAQKMEAIGQLAGGIAHDFNNLLTVIGGHAELARLRLGPNEAVSEHLKEIEVAQDRASSLTRQLLAFGRKQNLEERVVNPNAIIEQLQKMLRRLIGEDIELQTDCGPDLYNIRVDPGQLEQVITNLAVNARDAMPSGGVLSVSTRNAVLGDELPDTSDAILPGEYVRISVQDTGTGIDEQNIPRIFEPFFTTKAQGKGTGLGLSTVYGIIRQSRGYICCQSNPSNGTTFEIYLPRCDEGLSMETPEGQAAPAITSVGRGRTILVVEDETAVRSLVSRILRSAGFIVLEAANGWEALRKIRLYRPRIDLVLTDIVMPGMRGPSLVASIHEEAGYEQVRTLFMSGYAGPVLDYASERNEGVPVLCKPFRRQDVLDKVVSLLDE